MGTITIVWDHGADIDRDVLYHDLMPAWKEVDQTRAAGNWKPIDG
jgi:hypothetical protein